MTALVAHFWQHIPQERLHQMTNLLESSPAALVIVAIDATPEIVYELLPDATAAIITEGPTDEFGNDVERAIDDASAAG